MDAIATLSAKFQISIPKGKGVLLMPVPALEQLAGIAKGAKTQDYRDRKDRY